MKDSIEVLTRMLKDEDLALLDYEETAVRWALDVAKGLKELLDCLRVGLDEGSASARLYGNVNKELYDRLVKLIGG